MSCEEIYIWSSCSWVGSFFFFFFKQTTYWKTSFTLLILQGPHWKRQSSAFKCRQSKHSRYLKMFSNNSSQQRQIMPTLSCPFLLEFTGGPEFLVLAETLVIPHPLSGPWHSSVKLLGWLAFWKCPTVLLGRRDGRQAGRQAGREEERERGGEGSGEIFSGRL